MTAQEAARALEPGFPVRVLDAAGRPGVMVAAEDHHALVAWERGAREWTFTEDLQPA